MAVKPHPNTGQSRASGDVQSLATRPLLIWPSPSQSRKKMSRHMKAFLLIKLRKRSSSLQPYLLVVLVRAIQLLPSSIASSQWRFRLTVSIWPFLLIWSTQLPGSHANDAITEETAIPSASTPDLWRSHWIKELQFPLLTVSDCTATPAPCSLCTGAVPIKFEIYVDSSSSHSWKQENTTLRGFPSSLAWRVLRNMGASHFRAIPTQSFHCLLGSSK